MTKLEKKRAYQYSLHEKSQYDFLQGFDASTDEWKRIVEPLVEALRGYMYLTGTDGRDAREALEKYYEEIN